MKVIEFESKTREISGAAGRKKANRPPLRARRTTIKGITRAAFPICVRPEDEGRKHFMCVSIFSHVSFNKINYFLRQFPCVVHVSAGGERCLNRSFAIVLPNTIRFNFVFLSLASFSLGNGKTLKVRRGEERRKEIKPNFTQWTPLVGLD